MSAVACSRREQPTAPAQGPPVKAPAVGTAPTPQAEQSSFALGKELYANYCAACHGETGDGIGPAARFLYPKPRNFREGRFRLVSTANRVASDNDLMRVITRGMPGSAMFPFGHLTDVERRALVAHVRHLARSGVEQQLREQLAELGEDVDPKELAIQVDELTLPAEPLQLPADWSAITQESVVRGRQLYVKQACVSCHGETGKGDGVQEQRNDDGTPTRPRDLTRGIFKGGREDLHLYARTLLGMPGTPMPSSANLQAGEIADLIHYTQSLSDPSQAAKVEHQRRQVVASRVGDTLPDEIPESAWEASQPVQIVVSPLWWRDHADADLRVQALHDGQSLAVRLSWNDAAPNHDSVRIQDFEDMAAVQWFRGAREPFLGMGGAGAPVEVWVWEADWQADHVEYADVDTVYPDMAVDLYPLEKPAEGARPHATQQQPKEFLTGWAAGNLLSDPTRGLIGNSLQATGFGSLTTLPRVSQSVGASGKWNSGRWNVVLRRPLQVAADAGLPLAPGEKLSIAFAIWDGAARDRNGQKLVSIWHDLELSPSE
ncbi:MAG: c-type cytochrome [Planctomycetes bacterium]|nr:c-type cytochrome [Planctomycetota bacterium]